MSPQSLKKQASDLPPQGGPDMSRREQLIIDHLPQVRIIARRIRDRLPGTISLDDLMSAGVLGLIAAVDNFNPAQGVKLSTYAEYKIRGAILDSLRELDWAPRDRRKKARQIEKAIAAAEQRWKRTPTEEEISVELAIEVEEYRSWLFDTQGLDIMSLEVLTSEGESVNLLSLIPDSYERSPSSVLERMELKRMVADAVERLPRNEKLVFTLYYEKELTLREISKMLRLHESRISQLKSQATQRICSELGRSQRVA